MSRSEYQWFERLKTVARDYYSSENASEIVESFCFEDWRVYYEDDLTPREAFLVDNF